MFVVDTNVLLYAAESNYPEHDACRNRLEGWRAGPEAWFLTWKVLYEFLRVVTHAAIFPRPWSVGRAGDFVQALLDSPSLSILTESERHWEVGKLVFAELPTLSGNVVHDTHTAILMREHGIRRIYTRDTDFHRFPWVEVLDPR